MSQTSVLFDKLGSDICSPFFDNFGSLHVVFADAGEIAVLREDVKVVHSTNGQASSASFDNTGLMYITDFAHGAVLVKSQNPGNSRDFRNEQQEEVVAVYEDKPLRGPSSIAFDKIGNIFFTDCGPFGDTGLHSPLGSLFVISVGPSGKILKPIILEKLAGPSSVALSPDEKFIYVTEMMTNRVLRFVEKPTGVYHGSVFYQLSGGVGPSAVVCDSTGNLYVATYDVKESSKEGKISVIAKTGQLLSIISTVGPEISGLAIRADTLYITEQSTGSVLTAEIDY